MVRFKTGDRGDKQRGSGGSGTQDERMGSWKFGVKRRCEEAGRGSSVFIYPTAMSSPVFCSS